MTTQELADRIIDAVMGQEVTLAELYPDESARAAARTRLRAAVFKALHDAESWFCRVSVTTRLVNGLPLFGPEEEDHDYIEDPYEHDDETA